MLRLAPSVEICMLGLALLCLALVDGPLVNSNFEEPDLAPAWRNYVVNPAGTPVIRPDGDSHSGRQALLIEAAEPADIAVAQELALAPGVLYRATCWIRTADLAPKSPTDVAAALHVQSLPGGTLARSDSRTGTSPWRAAAAIFRAPPEGAVRISLFFVGYGRGTGRAWFDDVRLERLAERAPMLEVSFAQRSPAPIDVKQGGQFIEPLCGMIPAMLAQQVAHDSFEDKPPWRVSFRPGVDEAYRPWYPSGAVHLAAYAFDTERPFHGQRSQRIAIATPHVTAGLAQDGFSTEAGRGYHLRVHVRSAEVLGLRATLSGGGRLLAGPVDLPVAGPDWSCATATLTAAAACDQATLALEFTGPGTLWLDRVTLIADDVVCGIWRRDVVEALQALNPGIIRFGGSTLEVHDEAGYAFNWRACVGPRDARPPYAVACWGGLEANLASLVEVVELCRHIGAEPLLCIRWSGSTPAEAAAQVEYFNGPPDSPLGRLRAAHGHPAPYAVKFWQVGNEVGGDEYNASLAAFADAMHAVDPSSRIISSWGPPDLRRWGGPHVNYVSDHHYACADLVGTAARFEAMRAMARDLTDRPLRAAITEWNTTASAWGLGRAGLATLANALACSRYHHLLHRNADLVEITNRSNLVDSFCSGIIQTGPGWLYKTPTYYAQVLYARAAGSTPLGVSDRSGIGWPAQEPDVSATLSADGRVLRIYAVNSTGRAIDTPLELRDTDLQVRGGRVFTIADRDRAQTAEVLNSRDDPERISLREASANLRGRSLQYEFPPYSVTLLELQLGRP
jgi:alpha-N-arabinofuranosidase